MNHPGRLLALDIGTARTGVAVSDELRMTARALETVPTAELPHRLRELLTEYQTGTVVVGRPRSLDGSLGEQVATTDRIVEQLKGLPASFVYEDETGTTLPGGDDADAARAILEGYLREHPN